jgi:hypothetical protein
VIKAPARPILAILDCHTQFREPVPNEVCGGPVLVGLCLRTQCTENAHQAIGAVIISTGVLVFMLEAEDVLREVRKQSPEPMDALGIHGHAAGGHRVDHLHCVVEDGDEDGRVEVVVHRRIGPGPKAVEIRGGFHAIFMRHRLQLLGELPGAHEPV